MQGSGEQWWSHHSTKTLHHLLWYDEGTPLSRTCLFSLICFPSHLHATGFSSCRITTMIHSYLVWFLWWLRHGAIGPIEATLFRVNVDWTDFRIYTFELVIRLSNAKQLALRFSAVLRFPAAPDVPGIPVICTLSSEAAPNSQKLQLQLLTWYMTWANEGNRHVLFLQVWSLWYLVRWNMLCT